MLSCIILILATGAKFLPLNCLHVCILGAALPICWLILNGPLYDAFILGVGLPTYIAIGLYHRCNACRYNAVYS